MSSTGPPLRVALLFAGDANDPSARSGTPYGVLTGLRSLGVDVEVVDVRAAPRLERLAALAATPLHQRGTVGLPWKARVRRGYSVALQGAQVARWRSRTATRRLVSLRGSGTGGRVLDGVIQLGAGYEIGRAAGLVPRVVYDDMTVAQALAWRYPDWTAMGARDREERLAMQRRVYTSADACAMTSSWAASSAIHDNGVPSSRIHVVGAGSHDASRDLPRSWESPRFLLVSKDFARKNGPRVLEAFSRVRTEHPDARLDVVGGHPLLDAPGVVGHGLLRRDAPEQAALLAALFDAATCFVMPSLQEPAGVVFTEAAAAGLPSIGGTEGGSSDFVGEGGTLVDPTSTDAVAKAMLAYCDPGLAARTGALAARRAPLFTWQAVAGRLLGSLDLQHGTAVDWAKDLPMRATI